MSLIGLLNFIEGRQGREDYGKLLDEYRVPGDPNTPNPGPYALGQPEMQQAQQQQFGGFRGAGGLTSGGPPPEFYMRAGALPGYQQMAMQAQVGQQGMERQMQGQQWSAQNMTLAQKTEADANQQNRKWEQERRQFEWNNPSAYQQNQMAEAAQRTAQGWANVGINQQQLGLQQRKQEAEINQQNMVRQFPALGLTGQAAMDYRGAINKMDRAAEISTDVIDYLGKIGTGGKALDRGTVNAMNSAYQQHVVPALTTMVGTGTIQKGDMEFVQSVMGDPGAWATLDNRQKAKVAQILTSVEDERGRLYGLSGVRAPQTKKGGSAWARSREGAASAPDDTVWGP